MSDPATDKPKMSKKLTVTGVAGLLPLIAAVIAASNDSDPIILAIITVPAACLAGIFVYSQGRVDVEVARAEAAAAKSTTVAALQIELKATRARAATAERFIADNGAAEAYAKYRSNA